MYCIEEVPTASHKVLNALQKANVTCMRMSVKTNLTCMHMSVTLQFCATPCNMHALFAHLSTNNVSFLDIMKGMKCAECVLSMFVSDTMH